MRAPGWCLLALTLAAGFGQPAAAQSDTIVVLTALPVTHSIGSALAAQTSIAVQNVPERPRPMGALGDFLEARAEELGEQFRAAQAVITIGKIWSDDPLFTAARAANIRVIDIDASKPWSTTLEGVSVAFAPQEDVPWAEPGVAARNPSVYFWLSASNGARAAEIVAADFMRLSPKDSEQIRRNLTDYRRKLLALKLEYEVKLATLPDLRVFALAPEFVYLTIDMGLSVDGYFFKQDVAWSKDDLEHFTSYLKEHGIKVVLHKWEPAAPIQAAIDAAGARVVVLDTIDLGVVEGGRLSEGSYLQLMRSNLEALHAALSQP